MVGNFLLRLGIAISLTYLAAAPWIGHAITLPFALAQTPGLLIGHSLVTGSLALAVLLAVFPRSSPIVAAAYLLLSAAGGFTAVSIRDIALGIASLSLAFIREEHIPWGQRRLLARFFNR